MTQLMTFNEAREFLKVNKNTLLKLIRKGEIPAYKVGNLWRIDKDELIKWLKEKRVIQNKLNKEQERLYTGV